MVGKAVLLGLSTGLYCTSFCFPVLFSVMLSRDRSFKSSLLCLVLFLSGRFIAYIIVGLIAGIIGQRFGRYEFFTNMLIPFVFFMTGLMLILYSVIDRLPRVKICSFLSQKFQSVHYLFLLGFFSWDQYLSPLYPGIFLCR